MKKLIKYGLLTVLMTVFVACKEDHPLPIAFYHWQSTLNVNNKQKEYLKELRTNKLYVRFFDVDWVESENQAYPFATLLGDTVTHDFNVIPTVYITNKAMINTEESQLPELADNIVSKIKRVLDLRFRNERTQNKISEIQLDCDWTKSTKKKYFDLIKLIKTCDAFKALGEPLISATIRLHQVKYPEETGVPPVDKGMLMLYNMGDLSNPKTRNSILDIDITKKYIHHLDKYALPCDFAFPLFSWAVLIRNNEVIALLDGWRSSDLENNPNFKHLQDNLYSVKADTYLRGSFIYESDVIRIEEVDKKSLEKVVSLAVEHKNKKDPEFCFYRLNDKIIDLFSAKEIKAIVR